MGLGEVLLDEAKGFLLVLHPLLDFVQSIFLSSHRGVQLRHAGLRVVQLVLQSVPALVQRSQLFLAVFAQRLLLVQQRLQSSHALPDDHQLPLRLLRALLQRELRLRRDARVRLHARNEQLELLLARFCFSSQRFFGLEILLQLVHLPSEIAVLSCDLVSIPLSLCSQEGEKEKERE